MVISGNMFARMTNFTHYAKKSQTDGPSSKALRKQPQTLAISTLEGKENKRRLQTLSIDNAWSTKTFLYYLTFRMLQHTASEVTAAVPQLRLAITKERKSLFVYSDPVFALCTASLWELTGNLTNNNLAFRGV